MQRLAWILSFLLLLLASPALSQEALDIEWQEALERLDALESSGRFASETDLLDHWIEDMETRHGTDHQWSGWVGYQVTQRLSSKGQYREAMPYAERRLEWAKKTRKQEDPAIPKAMNELGLLYLSVGELETARSLLEGSVDLLRRFQGDASEDTLGTTGNLAFVRFEQGDLSAARELFEHLVSMSQSATVLDEVIELGFRNNLAFVLRSLGDLQGARQHQEEVYTSCLRLLGEEHPNTLRAMTNLGLTLRALGELERAKQLIETSLELRQQVLGEEHPDTLLSGAALAATLRALGDLPGAKQHYEHVSAVRSRTLGDSHPDSLRGRNALAVTLRELGELPEARRQAEQVVRWTHDVLGPEHPETLRAQANLAATWRASGHHEKAAQGFLEVFEVRQRLAGPHYQPNTEEEAKDLFEMGRAQVGLHALDPALAYFVDGLEALEAQTLRTDPSEDVKTRYLARYASAYKEALAVGRRADRVPSAFQILERYRNQSLLSLMGWNQPDASQDIPDTLRAELHRNARRYDQLTKKRDQLFPEQDPELMAEQDQLRRRREVIQGQIIATRRAQGDLPEPLQAEAVQNQLDPGTLLLSFAVGTDTSHLFALTRESLEAVTLDVTADVLGTQVDRLRTLDLEGDPSGAREALSQWLYQRLLEPVASQIQAAQRVLILADGPLNFLPFASLTRPDPDDPRGWQYLAQWKPIHSVQSATVYAELLAQRKSNEDATRPWLWVGFGNPVYPAADPDSSSLPEAVRSSTERGIWGGLTPLPHTEREIQGIAQLFPEERIQPFLHHDANEDQARQILGQASIVHFAAHGLADPDYPMDSFLALSLNDGDATDEHNGLLQAWEIADHLRLDADLVVLSACVTALGPNRGGEGLISLSRAFQIAGARSVLASLWSVNDLSTSELMLRFYRHLQAGESKDRALQLAQQELIEGPVEVTLEDGSVVERDFSSPYHWAAFQLIGDWR